VINKSTEPGVVEEKLKDLGIEVIGTIPYDPKLIEADLAGKGTSGRRRACVESIKKIKEKAAGDVRERCRTEKGR